MTFPARSRKILLTAAMLNGKKWYSRTKKW